MAKGLSVSVLRNTELLGDCTNGGVSSKHSRFTLTGPGVAGVFEPSEDAPELKLVIGTGMYLHAEPVEPPAKGNVGWMFGGNFIHTSDSRFPGKYPIPVHDREETQEAYNANSD